MSETILQEAQRVRGEREAAYGHPFDDYTRTGRMVGAIIDGWLRQQPGFERIPRVPDVPAEIGTLLQAVVKISRQVNEPARDNMTDLAGYADCTQACVDHAAEIRKGGR